MTSSMTVTAQAEVMPMKNGQLPVGTDADVAYRAHFGC